jgi:uncharacterized protein YjiS (DUF1127 family)
VVSTYGAAGLRQTATSTRRISGLFMRRWAVFQERRRRQRLLLALYNLSDWVLMNIGTSRGEIDCAALH